MAKRKLIAIVLIGLMVVAGGFYPVYADLVSGGSGNFKADLPVYASPGRNVSFELAAEFPEVGNKAMVYQVKPPEVTVEKVTEMGRRLGFQGEAKVGIEFIFMTDKSGGETRELMVDINSGAVRYGFASYMDKLYPLTPPTLPSEDEAKQIATQFLAQAGLLPPGAYASKVGPGGGAGGDGGPYYVTHLLVGFTWEFDGLPATGSTLSVRIGDGGEVVQVHRVWREVEPYKKVSIKSPQEAYQELVAGEGSCPVPSGCQKMVVEKITLAYWMEPPIERQEYVVPVYQFKGKCLDGEGNYMEDFTGWCQATS
jgi:hypothetical protein